MSIQPLPLNTPHVMSSEFAHVTSTHISPGIVHIVYRLPGGGAKTLEFTHDVHAFRNDATFIDEQYWTILVDGVPVAAKDLPTGPKRGFDINPAARTIIAREVA